MASRAVIRANRQVEVQLKDIGAASKNIDGISWQAQANPYSDYYITRIQFE
jgi:hypothetical protein